MVSVLKYKNLQIDNIEIGIPVKIKGTGGFNSVLTYNGGSFLIQSPEMTFNSYIETKFNKREFQSFLREFQEKVVSDLYSSSENYFKGKKFSENRIKESINKFTEENENGSFSVRSVNFSDTKFYDYFKDEVKMKPSFPYKGVCIFEFSPIEFIGKMINLGINIKSIKLNKPIEESIDNCILGEDLDLVEDSIKTEVEDSVDELDFFQD